MTDAGDVVQRQVDAYNAHDVDAFLSSYAPDATVTDGTGQVLLAGHDAMRAVYTKLFTELPDIHLEVEGRLTSGDWVVDQERARSGDRELAALLAYQVVDGLIGRVVMLSRG